MSGIEIVGIAASVLQLADVGARLSVKLFTFSRKVKDAKASIAQLSQEIASTGAALHELGDILEDDGMADLGSKNAIATTNQLLADCWRVFEDIGETMGDKILKSARNAYLPGQQIKVDAQPSFSFRRRLRFPFIEPEVQLLKSKLEGLKSSLMLMLQVLSVASQIRSRPKATVPGDQQALIQTLLAERQAHDEQFTQLMKRLEAVADDEPGESVLKGDVDLNDSTLVDSHPASPTLSSDGFSDGTPESHISDQNEELPLRIRMRAQEIKHHALLAHNLVKEVEHARYEINHGIRHNMQHAILHTHYQEWQTLARKYDPETLLGLFSHHEAVARYWIDRHDDNETDDDSGDELGPGAYRSRGGPRPKSAKGSHPDEKLEHIHFTDAISRKVNIPYETGRRWKNMKSLITKMFAHIGDLETHVEDERYDLIGPEGSIILPDLWDAVIEPGMSIAMMLWPLPEPDIDSAPPEDRQQEPSKKKSKLDSMTMPWMAGGTAGKRSRSARTKGAKQEALSNLLLDWTTLGGEEVSKAIGSTVGPPHETSDVHEETAQVPEIRQLPDEGDVTNLETEAENVEDDAAKGDSIEEALSDEGKTDGEGKGEKEIEEATEEAPEAAAEEAGEQLEEKVTDPVVEDTSDQNLAEDQPVPGEGDTEPRQEELENEEETEALADHEVAEADAEKELQSVQQVEGTERAQEATEVPEEDTEEAKATPATSEAGESEGARDADATPVNAELEREEVREAVEQPSSTEAVSAKDPARSEEGDDAKQDNVTEPHVKEGDTKVSEAENMQEEKSAKEEDDGKANDEEGQAEIAASPEAVENTAETKILEVEGGNGDGDGQDDKRDNAVEDASSIGEGDAKRDANEKELEGETEHEADKEIPNEQDEVEDAATDNEDKDEENDKEDNDEKADEKAAGGAEEAEKSEGAEDEGGDLDTEDIVNEDKEDVTEAVTKEVAPILSPSDLPENDEGDGEKDDEAKEGVEEQPAKDLEPPENPASPEPAESGKEEGKQENDDAGADGDDENDDEDEDETKGEEIKKDTEPDDTDDAKSDVIDVVDAEPATQGVEPPAKTEAETKVPISIEPSSDEEDDGGGKGKAEDKESDKDTEGDATTGDIIDAETATADIEEEPAAEAKKAAQDLLEPSSDEDDEDEDEEDAEGDVTKKPDNVADAKTPTADITKEPTAKAKTRAPQTPDPSSDEEEDEEELDDKVTKKDAAPGATDKMETAGTDKKPALKVKTSTPVIISPSSSDDDEDDEEDEDEDEDEDDDDDDDDDDDEDDDDEDESSDSEDAKVAAKKPVEQPKAAPRTIRTVPPGVNVATKKALFEKKR